MGNKPFGYRDLEVNEHGLYLGYFQFQTVTSGNPTVLAGRGLVSVARSGAGTYSVTVEGRGANTILGGAPAITDLAITAGKSYTAHYGDVSASAGRTTIQILVMDGTTESDIDGEAVISGLFLFSPVAA